MELADDLQSIPPYRGMLRKLSVTSDSSPHCRPVQGTSSCRTTVPWMCVSTFFVDNDV
jgi:hypothetical protein